MPSGTLQGLGSNPGRNIGLGRVQSAVIENKRQNLQADIKAYEAEKNSSERARKLEKSCEGFEAIFINTLLQEMRKSVPDDGLLPTSNATRTWQQLFDNQLAETLASRQEVGVAKMLYQQLQGGLSEKK